MLLVPIKSVSLYGGSSTQPYSVAPVLGVHEPIDTSLLGWTVVGNTTVAAFSTRDGAAKICHGLAERDAISASERARFQTAAIGICEDTVQQVAFNKCMFIENAGQILHIIAFQNLFLIVPETSELFKIA